jgi:hypothetical protein
MDPRKIGCEDGEVGGTGSESCRVVGFGISGVESSGSAVFIIIKLQKNYLMHTDESCIESSSPNKIFIPVKSLLCYIRRRRKTESSDMFKHA